MSDSYDKWNEIKKILNKEKKFLNFNQKEIFMAYVGKNIGFEQNGDKNQNFLRPVLIYKKFSKNLFLGIPLTTTQRDGIFYYSFIFKNDKISTALLSQIKLVDSKRCKYRMGQIKDEDFKKLVLKFKKLTDVTP
jgi:mRNA-degrading endonuclease toxin of MazEF toxin-antitoxin module